MTNQVLNDVLQTLRASRAALMACDNNDYILCFPNGLGVRFLESGAPAVCDLDRAETIVAADKADKMPEEAWAFTPIVKNGAGEQARIMPRQTAIKKHLSELSELIQKTEAAVLV